VIEVTPVVVTPVLVKIAKSSAVPKFTAVSRPCTDTAPKHISDKIAIPALTLKLFVIIKLLVIIKDFVRDRMVYSDICRNNSNGIHILGNH